MKQLVSIVAVAALFVACKNSEKASTEGNITEPVAFEAKSQNPIAESAAESKPAETAIRKETKPANIEWMSWTEAIEKSQVEEKIIFVDVYTNWCGWCKKMDATTFKNPSVVDYMNEHFYAVKLNAEQKEPITFNDKEYKFIANGRRGAHELAAALLDGRMSYPSYAFIGKPWDKTVVPGFMGVDDFSCVLNYFVDGAPNGKSFDEFKANDCVGSATE